MSISSSSKESSNGSQSSSPCFQLFGPAACDFGGSFVKLAYFRPPDPPELPSFVKKESYSRKLPIQPDSNLALCSSSLGGVVKFLKFPTTCVPQFIDFLIEHQLHKKWGNVQKINATGGGAFKFGSTVSSRLGIELVAQDEMKSLVGGINFLLQYYEGEEIFTYQPPLYQKQYIKYNQEELYPFILASVGSGVSILKVDDQNTFQRVSGSSIGGGTFWGLCRLLTNFESYEDLTQAIDEPEYTNAAVDLLVGDIYGGDYTELGLKAEIVASSFGKAGTSRQEEYNPGDIAKSLLFMTATNIAQIAYLNGKHHNVKRIIFSGGFVHQNPLLWKRLAYAIHFWSNGNMKAHFLIHDGYLGAIGALVCNSKQLPPGTPPQPHHQQV